jgi:hypothetical protein
MTEQERDAVLVRIEQKVDRVQERVDQVDDRLSEVLDELRDNGMLDDRPDDHGVTYPPASASSASVSSGTTGRVRPAGQTE